MSWTPLYQFERPFPAIWDPIRTAMKSDPISGRLNESSSGRGATTYQDEDGRDEERDLDAAAERNASPRDPSGFRAPSHDRGATLGGAADDREKDDSDEDLRHPERRPGALRRAHQDLAHPRPENRGAEEAPDRARRAPPRAGVDLLGPAPDIGRRRSPNARWRHGETVAPRSGSRQDASHGGSR